MKQKLAWPHGAGKLPTLSSSRSLDSAASLRGFRAASRARQWAPLLASLLLLFWAGRAALLAPLAAPDPPPDPLPALDAATLASRSGAWRENLRREMRVLERDVGQLRRQVKSLRVQGQGAAASPIAGPGADRALPAPFLFVAVLSTPQARRRRAAVRATWASSPPADVAVRFVLYESERESETLAAEVARHDDLLFVPGSGEQGAGYRGIVFKVLAAVRAVARDYDAGFVLKTDDDAFVDLVAAREALLKQCAPEGCLRQEPAGSAGGAPASRWAPQRLYLGQEKRLGEVIVAGGDKWRNDEYWSHARLASYMPYMFGGGYVYSGDLGRALLRQDARVPLFVPPNEDATFGLWLAGWSLRRVDSPLVLAAAGSAALYRVSRRDHAARWSNHLLRAWEPLCRGWIVMHKVEHLGQMWFLHDALRQCPRQRAIEAAVSAAAQSAASEAQIQAAPLGARRCAEPAPLVVEPLQMYMAADSRRGFHFAGGGPGHVWSRGDDRLLLHRARRVPAETLPGEELEVGAVELALGRALTSTRPGWSWTELATTRAWNFQSGAWAVWVPLRQTGCADGRNRAAAAGCEAESKARNLVSVVDRSCAAPGSAQVPADPALPALFCTRILDADSGTQLASLPAATVAWSPRGDQALSVNLRRLEAALPGSGVPRLAAEEAESLELDVDERHNPWGPSSRDGLWRIRRPVRDEESPPAPELLVSYAALFETLRPLRDSPGGSAARSLEGLRFEALPEALWEEGSPSCRHAIAGPTVSPDGSQVAFLYVLANCPVPAQGSAASQTLQVLQSLHTRGGRRLAQEQPGEAEEGGAGLAAPEADEEEDGGDTLRRLNPAEHDPAEHDGAGALPVRRPPQELQVAPEAMFDEVKRESELRNDDRAGELGRSFLLQTAGDASHAAAENAHGDQPKLPMLQVDEAPPVTGERAEEAPPASPEMDPIVVGFVLSLASNSSPIRIPDPPGGWALAEGLSGATTVLSWTGSGPSFFSPGEAGAALKHAASSKDQTFSSRGSHPPPTPGQTALATCGALGMRLFYPGAPPRTMRLPRALGAHGEWSVLASCRFDPVGALVLAVETALSRDRASRADRRGGVWDLLRGSGLSLMSGGVDDAWRGSPGALGGLQPRWSRDARTLGVDSARVWGAGMQHTLVGAQSIRAWARARGRVGCGARAPVDGGEGGGGGDGESRGENESRPFPTPAPAATKRVLVELSESRATGRSFLVKKHGEELFQQTWAAPRTISLASLEAEISALGQLALARESSASPVAEAAASLEPAEARGFLEELRALHEAHGRNASSPAAWAADADADERLDAGSQSELDSTFFRARGPRRPHAALCAVGAALRLGSARCERVEAGAGAGGEAEDKALRTRLLARLAARRVARAARLAQGGVDLVLDAPSGLTFELLAQLLETGAVGGLSRVLVVWRFRPRNWHLLHVYDGLFASLGVVLEDVERSAS